MFVVTRDTGVVISDVTVTAAAEGSGLDPDCGRCAQYPTCGVDLCGTGGGGGSTGPPWGGFDFSGAFDGFEADDNDVDGLVETFTFPANGAQDWAGAAAMNPPTMTLPNGGSVTFTGNVPSDGDVEVYFKFEKAAYPDTEPSYTTDTVTVEGSTDASYTIDIPDQCEKVFESFLLYIDGDYRDTPVVVKDVVVNQSEGEGDCGGGGGGTETDDESPWDNFTFDASWGGFTVDTSTNTYNYPYG
jgi:hypothetical protein